MRRFLRRAVERCHGSKRLDRSLSHSIAVGAPVAVGWTLVAAYIDLRIVFQAMGGGVIGFANMVGGIIFLPFTLGLAPFHALLASGDLVPLVVTYGLYFALVLAAAPHTRWYGFRARS